MRMKFFFPWERVKVQAVQYYLQPNPGNCWCMPRHFDWYPIISFNIHARHCTLCKILSGNIIFHTFSLNCIWYVMHLESTRREKKKREIPGCSGTFTYGNKICRTFHHCLKRFRQACWKKCDVAYLLVDLLVPITDAPKQRESTTRTAFPYQSVSFQSQFVLLSWKQVLTTHPCFEILQCGVWCLYAIYCMVLALNFCSWNLISAYVFQDCANGGQESFPEVRTILYLEELVSDHTVLFLPHCLLKLMMFFFLLFCFRKSQSVT